MASTTRQRANVPSGSLPDPVDIVDDGVKPLPTSPSHRALVNLRKQSKWILLGTFGTWYWQVPLHARDVLSLGGWSGRLATLALFLIASTVVLFGITILLPARGVHPDYARWHLDRHLRTLIPLLTLSIVCGFLALVLTLSPLFAPPPPSLSLVQRLSEAANAAGSNLQSAYGGVQLVASDAARAVGFKNVGSDSSKLAFFDTESLVQMLRLKDVESLAARLGVTPSRARDLAGIFDAAQTRAAEWGSNNVQVMGWTGAVLGSIATYLLVFGTMGLLGLFSQAEAKTARF